MECKLIEAAAFEELKAIVNRIQSRTAHLATKTMPRKPGGWLTQEEVCGMLRVSKRVLQYYRRQRKIPCWTASPFPAATLLCSLSPVWNWQRVPTNWG